MLIAHCSSSYVVGHSLLPRWRHIITLAVLSAAERSTKLSLGTKIDLMPRLNGPEILRRRTKLRNFAHSLVFQLIAFISVTSKLADHVDFPEASRVSIAPGPSWLQTETTRLTDQRYPAYTTYLHQNSTCRTSRTRQRLYSRKPGVATKMRRMLV
jgi:hypothetical protein